MTYDPRLDRRIREAALVAAQDHDYENRPDTWTRVDCEQVRRLLEGAAWFMCQPAYNRGYRAGYRAGAQHGYDPADVYPVGLLKELKEWRSRPHNARRRPDLGWRYLRNQARRRNWRAVRSYFNGYLAESRDGLGTRAGHGWTTTRACRDLAKHLRGVRP